MHDFPTPTMTIELLVSPITMYLNRYEYELIFQSELRINIIKTCQNIDSKIKNFYII